MERKARSVELLKDLLGIKAGTKFPVNPDGYDSYIGKNAVTIRIFKCDIHAQAEDLIADYPSWFKIIYNEQSEIPTFITLSVRTKIPGLVPLIIFNRELQNEQHAREVGKYLDQKFDEWLKDRCLKCGGALVSCRINKHLAKCEHKLPACRGCEYFDGANIKCVDCGNIQS